MSDEEILNEIISDLKILDSRMHTVLYSADDVIIELRKILKKASYVNNCVSVWRVIKLRIGELNELIQKV